MAALDGLLCPKGGTTQGTSGQALKKKCRHLPEPVQIAEPALSRASQEMLGKSRDWTCTERRKGCPGQRNRSRGLKVLWIHVHETRVYSAGPELGGEMRLSPDQEG